MRPRRLIAFLFLATAACSDSVGPTERLSGTYALLTVNGQPLPYVLVRSGADFRIEIAEGQLTLRSDLTFSEGLLLRTVDATTVSTQLSEVTGTWSGSKQLQLTANGAVVVAAVAGSDITTSDGEYTLIYQRSSDSGRPRP